ncbi:4-carboxy-4-hydroxy-2-oxoadipate aldolase [Paraburkholderia aspalathi]|uniref:Putative 4-hydroxy-4-methyl-2-oxoglutarate aldolase n=1 Tax=Paraburkholderia aspalathi TaxID=1324617 RepID=A0ABN7N7F0_9BURK|nr:RraA family protein [Paraburkholderia aspalathi]MBK3823629.1 RraA family protein [Paraburkholderia aspalathi]MBK3835489.1 RraA family protein [Paraburkholderia aspalathi]MBK3865237.1 RraA family protein [Paraburkholderia aspalathi]CAE6853008.1 4-carboxy-4-hydroxy-2-oxoadipate aldolase [Paraburkholderia aspalathi]
MRVKLATCPVSDALEQLGFAHPMLPPEIRPLRRDMVVIGRAMPVQDEPPVPHGGLNRYDAKPFGLLFESIEALRPNEVYIASGGPTGAARIGDLLASRVRKIGAAGVVLNAHVRDANAILELGLPTFAHGTHAYGLQGRHNVVDYRCSIMIGHVRIRPGDLIFGDGDGICVIPREAEREAITRAIAKTRLERNVREAIAAGRSVVDAFNQYSVM